MGSVEGRLHFKEERKGLYFLPQAEGAGFD